MATDSAPSESGEGGGKGGVDGGAAEDAEHGVAPPQVQAQGGGQGQDVRQRPGRVGQGQAALPGVQRTTSHLTMKRSRPTTDRAVLAGLSDLFGMRAARRRRRLQTRTEEAIVSR